MSIFKISIRQIKAARSLLDWSQEQLAEASGVSIPTVRRLEAVDGELGGRRDTAGKIVAALEAAGVEFTNGDQPGVRLKKQSFGKVAMPDDMQIGDYVMFPDDRPAPDIQSMGLVGQIIDPGHKAPDASKVYVRFPNGRESWVDRGSLVPAPKRN